MKQQYIPLDIPPEQAELMMLDRIHPDSPEGRAILSRSNASLEKYGGLPSEYYESKPQAFTRHEIILNSVSVESAQKWFQFSLYIFASLGVVAGGIYLVGLAVQFLAPYLDVLWYVLAALLIVPLVVVLSKIKTTKTVIYENRGPGVTVNKTYIQNNY